MAAGNVNKKSQESLLDLVLMGHRGVSMGAAIFPSPSSWLSSISS